MQAQHMTITIRHTCIFALSFQENDSEPRIRGLLIIREVITGNAPVGQDQEGRQ